MLLDTIRAEALAPPRASRVSAIVTTAIFDAANAADPGYAAYRPTAPVPGASAEAAAAQAAHDALALLFPAREAEYSARLAADLAAIPEGPARQAGTALGSAVARAAFDARAADGAAGLATSAIMAPVEPGRWRPTPPAFAPPLLPGWGAVTPFGIDAAAAFLPPPPPATGSPEYVADVAAVRALGGAGSALRTVDQTEIARFWADGAGTATPPGHWNVIATSVAEARGLGLVETARLLAMLNVALADAAIVAWDAKYLYDVWRPVTAIRQAGEVPATAALQDEAWTPLLATPPFPEYVSGHSTFSAAAAAVLAACFGTDAVSFTTTSDALGPEVTRSFASFSAAAAEAGVSRIYGGIHFPSGNAAGGAVGRAIGGSIADRLFVPVPEPGSLALATAAVMAILARGLFQPRSLLAGASPPRRSIASPASVNVVVFMAMSGTRNHDLVLTVPHQQPPCRPRGPNRTRCPASTIRPSRASGHGSPRRSARGDTMPGLHAPASRPATCRRPQLPEPHLEAVKVQLLGAEAWAAVILRQLLDGPIRVVPLMRIDGQRVVPRLEFALNLVAALPSAVAALLRQAATGEGDLQAGDRKRRRAS